MSTVLLLLVRVNATKKKKKEKEMELAFKLFQHVPEADLLDWIFFMRAVTQMASVFPSRCNVTYRAAGTPFTLTVVWFAQK